MMPFMTGNITTTVMQDIQDEKGNSVVVQVFNDGSVLDIIGVQVVVQVHILLVVLVVPHSVLLFSYIHLLI